ncbi:MAG: hypothetical protein EZS28_021982 [Streblomastix strix]|uniref:SH3 domain-containing protein n=1 Tax=Streblomastix strix TaxID=222440 RepID=A0A5J4VIT6_9EUKA|nr:MAG: hypothetical protein EZS28_021982 [Streblomastix strix]
MSNTEEYLEAQIDYAGQEGEAEYLPISKGDFVCVINKGLEYYIVEKDGKVGKVPFSIFKQETSENVQISENAIQTTSTSPISTQISNDDQVIPEKNETELFEFKPSVAANIVSQIISSNSISDVDNNMRMNWLTNQFAEASDDKLKENFNEQFQIIIKDNLGQCQSIHENALLDIIEIIAERGTNIPLEGEYPNKKTVFFDSMKNSGLLEKIENMIQIIIKDYKDCYFKNYCRTCLSRIRIGADEEGYPILIKLNYMRALSQYIGNSGGNLNEEDPEVCNGRKQSNNKPALKPQPQFIPETEEQIEEVGGLEEIESNLFNNGRYLIQTVKEAKVAIFKYFKDKSNGIRWGF